MQLNDLEIFCQLYQLQSINQVAQALGYAQSNISARLQQLEREFDTPLFNRTHQGITPTENGQLFYEYATDVLTKTSRLQEQLHPHHTDGTTAISELLFNYFTTETHAIDLNTHQYQIMSSSEIMALDEPKIDRVITYAQFSNPSFKEVDRQHFAATFLASSQTTNQLPYIVNSDHHCPFRARTLRFLHGDFSNVQEINSWESIINLVAHGQGIALLPSYLAEQRHLTIVWPKRHYQVPYATYQREKQTR